MAKITTSVILQDVELEGKPHEIKQFHFYDSQFITHFKKRMPLNKGIPSGKCRNLPSVPGCAPWATVMHISGWSCPG